jgi:membrane dipeptidase
MTDHPISPHAQALHDGALVWDGHSCLPLKPGANVAALARHRAAGVTYVSINVGMDMTPLADIISVLSFFRSWVRCNPEHFMLAGSIADIGRARHDNKLAVGFDLEGAVPMDGRTETLAVFHKYGIRQMHLIYNRSNAVGGGCHDTDEGLTDYGRAVVAEVNRVGIILDCSHAGERTSLDMIAASTKPAIFSHANARALADHPRNVSDAQIDACAAAGGLIGVNGVDLFLGEPGGGAEAMVRHIDYIAQRVGIAHVGIGLDYAYDTEGVEDMTSGPVDSAYWWPPEAGYDFGKVRFAPPEVLPQVTDGLLARGYSDDDVLAVLGNNFLRVAEASWQ